MEFGRNSNILLTKWLFWIKILIRNIDVLTCDMDESDAEMRFLGRRHKK